MEPLYILCYSRYSNSGWRVYEYEICSTLDYLQNEAQGKEAAKIYKLGEEIPVRKAPKAYDLGI